MFQKDEVLVVSKGRTNDSWCSQLDLEMQFLEETKADMDKQLEILRAVRAEALKARSPNAVFRGLPSRALVPSVENPLARNKLSMTQSLVAALSSDGGSTSSEEFVSVPFSHKAVARQTSPAPHRKLWSWPQSYGKGYSSDIGLAHSQDNSRETALSSTSQPSQARVQQFSHKLGRSTIIGDRRGEWTETAGEQGSRRSSVASIAPSFSLPQYNVSGAPSVVEDFGGENDEDDGDLEEGDEVVDRWTSRRSTVLCARETEVLLRLEDGGEIWQSKGALEKIPKLNLSSAAAFRQNRLTLQNEHPPFQKRGTQLMLQKANLLR